MEKCHAYLYAKYAETVEENTVLRRQYRSCLETNASLSGQLDHNTHVINYLRSGLEAYQQHFGHTHNRHIRPRVPLVNPPPRRRAANMLIPPLTSTSSSSSSSSGEEDGSESDMETVVEEEVVLPAPPPPPPPLVHVVIHPPPPPLPPGSPVGVV